mgnify:FL=1
MSIQSFSMKLKEHRIFGAIFDRKSQAQFIRYLISGFTAFGTEYMLFALLYSQAKTGYRLSNFFAMSAGFAISFTMNRKWSFKSRENLFKQLLMFAALFAVNLFISNNVINILSSSIGLSPLLSKLIVMGAIVIWNFIIYRKIIYRH